MPFLPSSGTSGKMFSSKVFKILRFQPLQTVVVIESIEHGALQADALLVNRFADISRILAERAAVDGLQIIRAQAAFSPIPAECRRSSRSI